MIQIFSTLNYNTMLDYTIAKKLYILFKCNTLCIHYIFTATYNVQYSISYISITQLLKYINIIHIRKKYIRLVWIILNTLLSTNNPPLFQLTWYMVYIVWHMRLGWNICSGNWESWWERIGIYCFWSTFSFLLDENFPTIWITCPQYSRRLIKLYYLYIAIYMLVIVSITLTYYINILY